MALSRSTMVAILTAVPLSLVTVGAPALAQPTPAFSPLVASVVPGLDKAVRTGALPGSQRLSAAVSLKLRNQSELDKLLADQAAGHARYFTPQQFRDRFGPTQGDVNRVTDYLRSRGLSVTGVSANRMAVDVSGTADQLGAAFGTSLSKWHDASLGRDFTSTDSTPKVPSALSALVNGVTGLDGHYKSARRSAEVPGTGRSVGNGPAGGYTPAQLRSAYGLDGLGEDADGTGQTIALFEYGKFNQADIDAFDKQYNLPTAPVAVKDIDGGNTDGDAAQSEVEETVEVVHAIAPKAHLVVYDAPNTVSGEIDMWNALVADNVPVVSSSWGLCEYDRSLAAMQAVDAVAKQASAQGMTFFAASGDAGAYDCERDTGTSHAADLAVDFPGSDPHVTSVGGTRLGLNADGTRSFETTWNQGGGWATGGGVSMIFDKPAWQTGDGKRQVPDVSAVAYGGEYSLYLQGSWTSGGGTSASAPLWAAYLTLVNQRAGLIGKLTVGSLNPKLYALGGLAVNDVTEGDNRFYKAGAGYDMATGWGTPNGVTLGDALLG
ncbi:protease pro-enzyme activation domain-containing protein [Kutzneria buriramensis]|uniref:Kumamolisin n=1 Tax=Kutzneria buriramensis TaxID=1045776 RepID=A0A3E0H6X9_9PSEU|nr:S53 family serine peptidase [Kutzneria buriramensis]REH38282.1 kumamolisin [Kutzneria buriramensis]